jgi:hypothetical protein
MDFRIKTDIGEFTKFKFALSYEYLNNLFRVSREQANSRKSLFFWMQVWAHFFKSLALKQLSKHSGANWKKSDGVRDMWVSL